MVVGKAERLQRDAGIEVDVRIELLLDEIFVRQRDFFQLDRHVEHRIVLDAEFAEHLMRGLLHDLGARIVVLVDAVAEAHQPERIVLVLGAGDELRDAVDRADFGQHVERCLIGAAMRRAPQAGDAGRDAGKWVGARRAGEPHRRGRRILLVVGMQDEDALHGARQHRIDLVILARHREAHVQEVCREIQLVLRINERLADMILVGHRRDRRHLGDQAHGRDHALVADPKCRSSRGRRPKSADHAAHHRHRMRIAAEAGEEARHLLVDHGVARDAIVEIVLLRLRRQLAIEQQVADFEEIAVLGELVDRIAAVQKNAFVAVDEGDLRIRSSPST